MALARRHALALAVALARQYHRRRHRCGRRASSASKQTNHTPHSLGPSGLSPRRAFTAAAPHRSGGGCCAWRGARAHGSTHAHPRTHPCTRPQAHARTGARTRTHAHRHAHARMGALQPNVSTQRTSTSHTHVCARARAHNMRTPTRMHTHTHTHARAQVRRGARRAEQAAVRRVPVPELQRSVPDRVLPPALGRAVRARPRWAL
jgi:hypothetical protein